MDVRLLMLVLVLTALVIYLVIQLGRMSRLALRTPTAPPPLATRLADMARELAIEQGQTSRCFDVITADNQLVSVHRADCLHARIKLVEKLVENDLNDGVPLHEVVERLKSIGVVASMPHADTDTDADTDPLN